ncbi:MAG: hypothetical protein ACRCSB_06185 [Bacteroidales bacterium]
MLFSKPVVCAEKQSQSQLIVWTARGNLPIAYFTIRGGLGHLPKGHFIA